MLAVALLPRGARAQPSPQLEFDTLGAGDGARARLVSEHQQIRAAVQLVGLTDPGAPIRVVLAGEDTDVARATPSWIAGFAHGATDTVVLFPARSLRYPHDSLQSVLLHEVAHVLIHRAAAGQAVPRWFNEGLATIAERSWHFEDRRQLAWVLVSRGPVGLDEVERLFGGGHTDASGAYALASAFVRDVIDSYGVEAPARILAEVASGASFDTAFLAGTGEPLDVAERSFFRRLTTWERWVPLLTSPFVLWTLVTLLALYAIVVRRRRRAERRRQWDEEEAAWISSGGRGDGVAAALPEAWPPAEDPLDDESPRNGGRH